MDALSYINISGLISSNNKEDTSYQSHGSMHTLRKRHVSTDQRERVRAVLHTVAQKLSNVGARKPYSMMLAIDAVVRSMCIENCSGVSSKSCTNWQNLFKMSASASFDLPQPPS
jgi:hypothetical protein